MARLCENNAWMGTWWYDETGKVYSCHPVLAAFLFCHTITTNMDMTRATKVTPETKKIV